MFCASVSGHRYLCSKFIITPITHDRGSDMIREVFIFVLCVLYLFCTHVAFVSFEGYVLGIVCRLYGVYHSFMQPVYIV